MGNGSSKPGDAVADKWRDEFTRNRMAMRKAREALASMPEEDTDASDTQRIEAILADSRSPAPARGVVGVLAAFPKEQRLVAFIILAVLLVALAAFGVGKAAGWLKSNIDAPTPVAPVTRESAP